MLLGAMYPTRNIFRGFPSCRLLITLHIGVNGAHWLPVGLIFRPFVYYEIRLGGLDSFVSISLSIIRIFVLNLASMRIGPFVVSHPIIVQIFKQKTWYVSVCYIRCWCRVIMISDEAMDMVYCLRIKTVAFCLVWNQDPGLEHRRRRSLLCFLPSLRTSI